MWWWWWWRVGWGGGVASPALFALPLSAACIGRDVVTIVVMIALLPRIIEATTVCISYRHREKEGTKGKKRVLCSGDIPVQNIQSVGIFQYKIFQSIGIFKYTILSQYGYSSTKYSASKDVPANA
jgi:hypothetical protein